MTRPISELHMGVQADAEGLEAQAPRSNIAPGENIVVLDGDRLVSMRWGILPVARVNARGRPVMETLVNARSETVFQKSAYEGVRRVVVPVDGWYEWTGEARKKTAWQISAKSGEVLLFAGIADTWTGPGGVTVDQVATLTCEPNKDLAPIHHRMGVILKPDDVPLWLRGGEDEVMPLMTPWPDGLLSIRAADGVDWAAP